jgi:hypothetical protein
VAAHAEGSQTLKMQRIGFEEYLAGGFLANAPVLFFIYIVKSLHVEEVLPEGLELASAVAVAIGGMAAGYLVVRVEDRNHLHVGLKTGVAAFLVNFTLSSILIEGTTILYGLWILLLFCFASVIGTSLRRITTGRSGTLEIGRRNGC